MEVTVFGANEPTGRSVVRQALAAGDGATTVTRKPGDQSLTAPRLRVVSADVTNAPDVAAAVIGSAAVISTYGVPHSRHRITVYSEGPP